MESAESVESVESAESAESAESVYRYLAGDDKVTPMQWPSEAQLS